jgi:hypothetical protein
MNSPYLGEFNDAQERQWTRSVEAFFDDEPQARIVALFPEERLEAQAGEAAFERLPLAQLASCQPRQRGGCCLALELWRQLQLASFCDGKPPPRSQRHWLGLRVDGAGRVSAVIRMRTLPHDGNSKSA